MMKAIVARFTLRSLGVAAAETKNQPPRTELERHQAEKTTHKKHPGKRRAHEALHLKRTHELTAIMRIPGGGRCLSRNLQISLPHWSRG
jgi:hypothetical protein